MRKTINVELCMPQKKTIFKGFFYFKLLSVRDIYLGTSIHSDLRLKLFSTIIVNLISLFRRYFKFFSFNLLILVPSSNLTGNRKLNNLFLKEVFAYFVPYKEKSWAKFYLLENNLISHLSEYECRFRGIDLFGNSF